MKSQKRDWVKIIDYICLVPASIVKLVILTSVMYFLYSQYELKYIIIDSAQINALRMVGVLGIFWIMRDWIHCIREEFRK